MKLWAIIFNTFRETVRDRILYNLLVFAVFMILLSMALGRLSFTEQERITVDVGLTTVSVFSLIMAVFLGIRLINKEIDKKTVYTLIAKPVPRYYFILGRYLGLMLTIGLNILIMAAAFGFIICYIHRELVWPIDFALFQALLLIYLEVSIIIAAAMVFSSFSTATLSAIFTLCFLVIGRFTAGIYEFAEKAQEEVFKWGGIVLYYVVPNLTDFVQVENAVYGEPLPGLLFLSIIGKGVLWTAFFLLIAIAVFQKKDFL
ncbi:MAG: ABC transporter permease subunit [bacterium]